MTRLLGGELLVPPGHAMTVAAPTAGIVLGPERGAMLPAGAKLEARRRRMELLPLPPDSELLAAREDIAVREAELNVARARAERAAQLLTGRSGSQEQLEQAQADLVRAEAAFGSHDRSNRCCSAPMRAGLTPMTLVSQAARRARGAACCVGTARGGRCAALHRRSSRPLLGARAGVLFR